MKVLFTYILLIAFAFRPVYTISYIGYFELNIDYIVETYCINKEKPQLQCNGKCHLADQLNLSDESSENPDYIIVDAFFPVYFQTVSLNIEGDNMSAPILKHCFNYSFPFYISPNTKIVPPPKLS